MNKSLLGVKVAMLVANGFAQNDMIAAHKALINAGANVRIVSPESGLVNGWEGESWGHHFAVDAPLSTALGADYAVLVIPGGQRSMEKLNLTGHTKRFVNSFMEADKPVIVMDDALHIMMLTDSLRGRTVGGSAMMSDVVVQAGGLWDGEQVCYDNNLMSGPMSADDREAFAKAVLAHIESTLDMDEADRSEQAA